MGIVVAACSRHAAVYAVHRWHYSTAMPIGKLIYHGIWTDRFWGTIIYGRGAGPNLFPSLGFEQTEGAELVRVAIDGGHPFYVSEAVAASLRLLRRTNPGLRLVISFADPVRDHHGGIYQAGNWIYLGVTTQPGDGVLLPSGELRHNRAFRGPTALPLPPGAKWVRTPPKHKYLFPLDRPTRRRMDKLAQPYPPPC